MSSETGADWALSGAAVGIDDGWEAASSDRTHHGKRAECKRDSPTEPGNVRYCNHNGFYNRHHDPLSRRSILTPTDLSERTLPTSSLAW